MRKLLSYLIAFLYKLSYKPLKLDSINKKLIKPVPGLVIDGTQYYEFVQVADMPQNRFVHYLDFREESQAGITRDKIIEYIQAIEEANNNGDVSRVGALCFMMRDTVTNCTPLDVLYNIASLRYFDLAEDIGCYDLDYNEQKIRKFKQVKDKDFFLRYLLDKTLKPTGKSLPGDLSLYLKRSMAKLQMYDRILEGTGNETGSDLTP